MGEMKIGISKWQMHSTNLPSSRSARRRPFLPKNEHSKPWSGWKNASDSTSCNAAIKKEVRQLIADSNERLSTRVAELEKAEPIQAQTSKWVTAGVWGALAMLASFIVPRILERVFQ